ncbi:MAG: class I SAM-dependent methyltransferase [Proteobacteria bacterium]|nr:class I SAM-dependent methyltransferase [Pseudomonadota bacterium]
MKKYAAATMRNREPIAEILRRELPASGTVLEIASGTGQHIVHFAREFPHLTWQPSDVEPSALASIRAWRDEAGLANLLPPLAVDVTAENWPIIHRSGAADRSIGPVEAVLNINMIHISPWPACSDLFRGARDLLPPAGLLYIYGPYFVRGRIAAPSNLAFDASLRARNPDWGIRYLDDVEARGAAFGFSLCTVSEMPKNNLSLIFRRDATAEAARSRNPTKLS